MNPYVTPTFTPLDRPRAAGFSLVEMVVSLAVVSVLLVGMTSAIVLASRALPSGNSPAASTVKSARALHQLRDELRAATQLLNRTATSVTLHLPDRDGDGRSEVITYAWAGNPGDPLLRSANGNAAATAIDHLDQFALKYDTTDQSLAFPGPPGNASAEQLLSSFETSDTANTEDHRLNSDQWIGTIVDPALPTDAAAWRITRALFYGNRRGGPGSTITFELRGSLGDTPNATIHDATTLDEADLNGWAWYETVFESPDFTPAETAAIALANYGGGDAGVWNYYTQDSAPTQMFNSNDGGDSWNGAEDNEELSHYVYGTYDLRSDDWTYTRQRIAAVEITLTHGSASAMTHQLNVALPNAPEAVAALWEADFNADPTTVDANSDGVADWQDAGTFAVDNLDAGRWEATDTLRSAPDSVPLDKPFVLDLWLEDTLDNGNSGGVRLWFDRDNGQHACIAIEVNQTGGSQEIAVVHEVQTGTMIQWVSETRPVGVPIHVSLLADTVNDTVGIMINGDHAGSFAYKKTQSFTETVLNPFVTASNSGIVFRHLKLAIGGTTAITPGAYNSGSGSDSGSGAGSRAEASLNPGEAGDSGSNNAIANWWENLFRR